MKKKDKELEEYRKSLMGQAKGTMALGTIGVIGTAGFSHIKGAFPATAPVANSAIAGMQLAQVGNLASVGMNIVPPQKSVPRRDGSGRGVGANMGRGGCTPPKRKNYRW